MVLRSVEEIALLAYLLRALGLPCTVPRLISCLETGARNGLWDACIELDDGNRLWIDYDGGYYHTPERVDHDMAKSRRKLAEHPRNRVLRVRAKAPSIAVLVPWCETPVTLASKPWEQLRDIRAAAMRLLTPSFAAKLSRATLQRDKIVDAVAHDVVLTMVKRYKREFALLEGFLGTRGAKQMLQVGNIKTLLRSGHCIAALHALRTDLGLDAAQLVTFMCDGVAARLTDDGFMVALKRTGCKRKHVAAAIRAFPTRRCRV